MKPSILVATLAIAFGSAGCKQSEPTYDDAQPSGMASTTDAPVIDASGMPTQAEADAAAAKQIDAQNAEAELEKLKAELGGG
jgi:hypothetical protein